MKILTYRNNTILKAFTFIALLSMVYSSVAQKKQFTLNDVISGGANYNSLKPKTLKELKWLKDESSFSFIKDGMLVIQSAKNGKQSQALTTDELNSLLHRKVATFPEHAWLKDRTLQVNTADAVYFIDLNSKKIKNQIATGADAKTIDLSPNGKMAAYTIQNNLYIGTPSFAKVAITNDEDLGIVNGQTVHRNEFGITKGTFWSPNSKLLAFYRKDERMVAAYPLLNALGSFAKIETTRYPMAGMTSEKVQVGVYNPQTGHTLFLKTVDPTDRYFTNIAWSPDSKIIYIAEITRDQNHMQLKSYDAKTGDEIAVLFEEYHEKYVEPEHPLSFSPNGETFVWQSERDGYNHLYLYQKDGTLIKQLSKGDWMVDQFHGWDTLGENIYVTTTEMDPLQRHLYKINIATSVSTLIEESEGTHHSVLSFDKSYALDAWSSYEVPNKIDLIALKGKSTHTTNLLTAPNPYSEFDLGDTKVVTLKTKDGQTTLYGRMITPPNMQPGRKYPVIVYVYGGPHVQQVKNEWMAGARMWQHYMAQKGYIAFTLDNRGSAGRGLAFENAIHRHLGVAEMSDQMQGINYLKTLNFVDADRIGVHGWSFGGFMTTSLMTHHAETFKVGVAGGPVINWRYYEVMYGERYMDRPQDNPEGYKASNLLPMAKKLKGRLMIIHGDMDPTVVLQNSLQFIEKCVEENIPIDYFIYPGYGHNVRGKDRVHLMQKVSQYFFDFL